MNRTPTLRYSACALTIMWLLLAASSINADVTAQQRDDYLTAKTALNAKDFKRFLQLLQRLDGYPLAPFLEYEFLKTRVDELSAPALQSFIERNQEAFISEEMRKRWLRHLAHQRKWKTFLTAYHPSITDADLRCSELQAEISESGFHTDLDQAIEALWLVGRSQRPECDAVFAAWNEAGGITRHRVWSRIELAMGQGQTRLARYLAREHLGADDQLWVQRWQRMHDNPHQELARPRYSLATPRARAILRHGISRLTRMDLPSAMGVWTQLSRNPQLTDADREYALRQIGLHAAWQHHSSALAWLEQLPPEGSDEHVRHWRVLAALRTQQWATGLRSIANLTPEERNEAKWLYWKARLLTRNGDPTGARKIFQALANSRHYYGFLAADQLDRPYDMEHKRLKPPAEMMRKLPKQRGINIAYELRRVGELAKARSQWSWATRNMDQLELQAAATLAHEWQWHDRAILTVARAGHRDDLELRFPLLHRDLIESNALSRNLDLAWVFGVVRQESAFDSDARSHAGALGLMQLMPHTAKLEGRKYNLKLGSARDLLQADRNILLGTSYLRTMLDKLGGNPVLATASYNAGPQRVRKWLPEQGILEADIWVETIPFAETRDFVKNVLAFSIVYDYRLGREPTRLRQRMPAISSAG